MTVSFSSPVHRVWLWELHHWEMMSLSLETKQVNQIATATEQQTATISEISNNIHEITGVINHTARGAQESASAASQLAGLSEELKQLVGQFKLA